MSDTPEQRGVDEGRLVDWLLGERPEMDLSSQSEDIQSGDIQSDDTQLPGDAENAFEDAELAELGELKELFGSLREISVAPTGQVGLRVRGMVERRARRRRPVSTWQPRALAREILQIAAVAAVVVGGTLLAERLVRGGSGLVGADAESPARVMAQVARAPQQDRFARPMVLSSEESFGAAGRGPRFLAKRDADGAPHRYRPYRMDSQVGARFAPKSDRHEELEPQDLWMHATNAVASMRAEFASRYSPALRRRAIRAAGGSHFLAPRIEQIAEDVASKVVEGFRAGDMEVREVALGLRALMAGGSSRRLGAHAPEVRQCTDWLLARLPRLRDGELATALSGLVEVAVVSGPDVTRVVGLHASRLAESILYSHNSHRPSMLSWHTTPEQLADAGQVLRLAPAFGAVHNEARLARQSLATHLAERLDAAQAERPDLLAAQLYGFGDLVDRAALVQRLQFWRPMDLVPDHYVALLHSAWSRFPVSSGWADFQMQMRKVAVQDTPDALADASALLLSLAVSYAAPGSHVLVQDAHR